MKSGKVFLEWCLLGLGALPLAAQDAAELEKLQKQLREARENFERVTREQRQLIEDLARQVQELQRQGAATNVIPAAVPTGPTKDWRPGDPLRIGSQSAYADIGFVGTIAVGGSTASDIEGGLQPGGHDPNQRGFTLQGLEMSVTGAVDPYFRGAANVSFALDAEGETFLELEEAWLETMSLPWNLQVRAGQMFTDFGRHNATHLHAWSFVDAPLVNARFLGPDGLRNPGARLAWLTPTPFFSELSFGVQNSQGETAASFRSAGGHHHGDEEDEHAPFAYRHADNDRGVNQVDDMLFSTRYSLSFDLTPTQVLLAGGSAAFGPNSRGGEDAGETTTQIFGVDLTWKWKSPRHQGGFPFVQWQTEGLLRKYDAGAFDWSEEGAATDPNVVVDMGTGAPAVLSGETLVDYGLYSQLLYGFRKGWVAGLRADFVTGDEGGYERRALTYNGEALGRDPQRAQRWRLSPNLTWYPTEFSKIRLQYNFDDRLGIGQDHSVWLQFEFLLGAHAAHRF